jgi:hypothetical protein
MKEVTELPNLILGYAEVIQNQASLLTQHPLEMLREMVCLKVAKTPSEKVKTTRNPTNKRPRRMPLRA